MTPRPAPAWRTTDWLNTPEPLTLERLRGKVILLHAFQMLCPGCVARGIPQAQRVAELFAGAPLVVVGLHTVFEHHEAMKLESLRAFLHEYRVRFPVGVDAPGEGGDLIPRTMRAYAMQGTPTTVLIDAQGRLRRQVFGMHDDLQLGAELQTLLLEVQGGPASGVHRPATRESSAVCDDSGCAVPSAATPA
ncbi:redoxin domain-containing protein [Corallococcus exiguus]|uniref:redoxin domain-containing protein n=1 Tax=Corallococcus TaxID=83461 RepID=UPI000EA3296D|nr:MULTISPECIES: redoxin domain-containing protein [Corallococcus]NNC21154.1 redoxin domain-containing protein [Corallococcus exiguus]NRD57575.1 redoxin domain-containing protein [Corallococcus exiguus]NRD62166.1 redoxin domain-containing protein [Corallococcus exiguus]RKH25891.1 TlpA family protein disulfide reductase [Corallococcus sp. CA041A]RUO92902.1 TlpA family protein disulfide reductase [Corallococcus sp. AB018]